MATATLERPPAERELRPTLGPVVCRWIERFVPHAEGDFLGDPFILEDYERRFIYRLYEYDPTTRRRVKRRALLGLPKGNAKTELLAAIGLAEFAGPTAIGSDGAPTMRRSPNIPVAAASFEQADLPFGAARTMVAEGPLADHIDAYDTELLLKDRPGRLFRVAAEAGTNDGGRPTAFLADELHEWKGRKARVHLVVGNSLSKRAEGLELNVSTAGDDLDDPDSLLGRLYLYGKRVEAGEVDDPSFLFDWHEPPDDQDFDLADPAELREAIRTCTPASWLDIDRIAARFEVDQIPEHEFRRYHLNQWTKPGDAWLPVGSWAALEADQTAWPADDSDVQLGFDGSYARDSTALYGWTTDGYGFVVGVWERPDDDRDWHVPRDDVHESVVEAFARWNVLEMACDPPGWHREIDDWIALFGEERVIHWPTNSRKRMAEACSRFYTAVVEQTISHDGNPAVARHLANCVTKQTPMGMIVTKDRADSPRKIDLAVAAIVGHDRMTTHTEESVKSPGIHSDADPDEVARIRSEIEEDRRRARETLHRV